MARTGLLSPALPRVVLAALTVAALVSCGDEAAPDEVLAGQDRELRGDQAMIQLPHGQLRFTVTDAEPVSADELTDNDQKPSGEYVGLDWEWKPGAGVPGNLSGYLIADQVPAELSVKVGGTTHKIGPTYTTKSGVSIAGPRFVPADDATTAGDVRLDVAFDGLTQTVQGDGSDRSAGAAEPLYSLPESGTVADCVTKLSPAQVRGEPTCDAATVRLPYVTDLGWAADGTSWLAVDLSVLLTSYDAAGDEHTVTKQTEQLTVAGAAPAAVLNEGAAAPGRLVTLSVFEAPAGKPQTAEFTRVVLPAAPGAGQVTLTGTVREQS